MWLQCEKEHHTERERARWDNPWPCGEILRSLIELNEQCLELLTAQALQRSVPAAPMLRDLGELWSRLDQDSRRRAAGCPFLLLDAGFTDLFRWRWVAGNRVEDREPAVPSFFSMPAVTGLAHQVFSNAWYMVRTQPLGVPLFLGMSAPCAALLRACTLRQITELAERQAAWLRPRWPAHTRIWGELLGAAISGEGLALEKARMHGVNLLAMEMKSLEEPRGGERR
ncbi:MAG TPA: hypothetical protein VGL55_10430 [Steroidobacteraceae bacterium]|jgi:hypothetical protein